MSFTARFNNEKDAIKTAGIFNSPREGDKLGLTMFIVNEKRITFFGIRQV
jgi:hypothetical protein